MSKDKDSKDKDLNDEKNQGVAADENDVTDKNDATVSNDKNDANSEGSEKADLNEASTINDDKEAAYKADCCGNCAEGKECNCNDKSCCGSKGSSAKSGVSIKTLALALIAGLCGGGLVQLLGGAASGIDQNEIAAQLNEVKTFEAKINEQQSKADEFAKEIADIKARLANITKLGDEKVTTSQGKEDRLSLSGEGTSEGNELKNAENNLDNNSSDNADAEGQSNLLSIGEVDENTPLNEQVKFLQAQIAILEEAFRDIFEQEEYNQSQNLTPDISALAEIVSIVSAVDVLRNDAAVTLINDDLNRFLRSDYNIQEDDLGQDKLSKLYPQLSEEIEKFYGDLFHKNQQNAESKVGDGSLTALIIQADKDIIKKLEEKKLKEEAKTEAEAKTDENKVEDKKDEAVSDNQLEESKAEEATNADDSDVNGDEKSSNENASDNQQNSDEKIQDKIKHGAQDLFDNLKESISSGLSSLVTIEKVEEEKQEAESKITSTNNGDELKSTTAGSSETGKKDNQKSSTRGHDEDSKSNLSFPERLISVEKIIENQNADIDKSKAKNNILNDSGEAANQADEVELSTAIIENIKSQNYAKLLENLNKFKSSEGFDLIDDELKIKFEDYVDVIAQSEELKAKFANLHDGENFTEPSVINNNQQNYNSNDFIEHGNEVIDPEIQEKVKEVFE